MPSIRVIVHEATGLPKKSGFMDKTDPYVELQMGSTTVRTNTKKNAGMNAEFHQALTLPYMNDPYVLIHVLDDDGGKKKDDLLASTTLNLTGGLLASGQWQGVLPLTPSPGLQNKSNPAVKLTVQYIP